MTAMLVRDILADPEFWAPPQRHPVVRSGEREPIPWVVRASIYRRDGQHCRECGWWLEDGTNIELDHILPWSAGGGDHSANLRVLCSPCNQRRSNWIDHERELRPTTWWCSSCWLHPEVQHEAGIIDYDGLQRKHRPAWRDGVDLSRAPYVVDPQTLVYCAWCWGYGLSDVAFTTDQQDWLASLVVTDTHPTPDDHPTTHPEHEEQR